MTDRRSRGGITILELILVSATLGILAAILMPPLDDRSYLAQTQRRHLAEADLILLCAGERNGEATDYRVREIWRNRGNQPPPVKIGEVIRELRDAVHPERRNAEDKVVFYRRNGNAIERLGGMYAYDNKVMIKLDIGARNGLERWLDRPVELDAFKHFVQCDACVTAVLR